MWQECEVEARCQAIAGEKNKRLALKIQLHFRQKVTGAKCNRSYFTMSSSGKIKSIEELVSNLKCVIRWSSSTQSGSDDDFAFSKPFIINPHLLGKQKDIYKEMALKTSEKLEEKGSRKRHREQKAKFKIRNQKKTRKKMKETFQSFLYQMIWLVKL